MRNLIILCVLFVFSCQKKVSEPKIAYTFYLNAFNSSYTLNLLDNEEFILNHSQSSCFIETDENGKELPNKRTHEKTEGKYFVKGNKMFFSVYKGRNYIDTEYYIFPHENGTFLIENDSAFINEISSVKAYFDEEFPESLLKAEEVKMLVFYSSNDIYPLDKSDKEQVYNLLK